MNLSSVVDEDGDNRQFQNDRNLHLSKFLLKRYSIIGRAGGRGNGMFLDLHLIISQRSLNSC